MKLPSPFSIYDLRFTSGKKPVAPAVNCDHAANRQSAVGNRQSEKGIALVITLILLSVTLIMALALLALSNRERNSVTTTTDTAHAKLAADSALAAAQAEIIANIFATNNGAFNFGLLVSTNYQNAYGYVPGTQNPTNVNYDYRSDGTALNAADFVQNVANLEYLPRAPVFITNSLTGTTDFRFYLDLNRNGQFDTNGFVPNVDANNNSLGANIFEVGDPEWIGVLARPDAPHSANNQFIARYAFFALPIGNGLDLNAIFNEAAQKEVNPAAGGFDGFFRNQGVGSWEINLAAFLADLNTNQWDLPASSYTYTPPPLIGGNSGIAFDDARALLSYRYNFNYANQMPLGALSANGITLENQPFDLLLNSLNGPLMTNTYLPYSGYVNLTNNLWAGSDNTNQFFDLMSDLFDTNKTAFGITGTNNFSQRLQSAGTGNGSANPSTYDRYTFYRMLAQLGTDSDPDAGKMNLNYSNVQVTYSNGLPTAITVIPGAETNLVSWTPTNFFIAAANRMLLNYSANWFADSPSNYLLTYYGVIVNTNNDYYNNANGNTVYYDPSGFGLTNFGLNGTITDNNLKLTNQIPSFGITNIPVYINGQFVYTPAVNRVLQLAANLYDASTNYFFPSVFRPTFLAVAQNGYTNVYINGYQQVISVPGGINDVQLSAPIGANVLLAGNSVKNYVNGVNVYNVPWIIGAKKGFPNFNNLSEENQVNVIRRLQLSRNVATSVLTTNLMYMMSIQSTIGVDFWNSYASNYNDNVSVAFRGSVVMGLTNSEPNFNNNEAQILNVLTSANSLSFSNGLNAVGNGGIGFITGGLGYTYEFSTNQTYWPGTANPVGSFTSPYITWSNNVTVMPFAAYRSQSAGSSTTTNGTFNSPVLLPAYWFNTAGSGDGQLVYETNGAGSLPNYQLPQIGLLATNRFQAFVLDTTANRVVDYVQLNQVSSLNVNANIYTNAANSTWNSNASTAFGVTLGVLNQISISRQGGSAPDPFDDGQGWNLSDLTLSRPGFTAVLNQSAGWQTNNQPQAGYTPMCAAVGYTIWSANDPLVHYTVGDLAPSAFVLPGRVAGTSATLPSLSSLGFGTKNPNYFPWGGAAPTTLTLTTAGRNFRNNNGFSFWLKDPLAYSSTNWDFPTYKYPSIGWIGRVHRGTPWQTVYLKSTDVLNDFGTDESGDAYQGYPNGEIAWSQWTGDQNFYDASNSAPVLDRQLFDLFTTALNDNATRGTLSVNVGANGSPSLAAWSAVLSGVVVLTNVATTPQTMGVSNSWLTIKPAGVAGTNSLLGEIVSNINATRAAFTNANGVVGSFEHVGDVLSVPALTVGTNVPSPWLTASPYLNLNASQQQQSYGISDEVYEQIPQQIMGLLRVSTTPRYVIYGYGQTLRPANKGLVLDNSEGQFGLVTNYQVVAESAVRAVVSVQTNIVVTPTGFQTNYTAKVESYNVLPPN